MYIYIYIPQFSGTKKTENFKGRCHLRSGKKLSTRFEDCFYD